MTTFINMKPVWFDLEQLLYLKRKNHGEGLSRVDLSPLKVVALASIVFKTLESWPLIQFQKKHIFFVL